MATKILKKRHIPNAKGKRMKIPASDSQILKERGNLLSSKLLFTSITVRSPQLMHAESLN